MNKEVENFLASFPYAEKTKDSYRRILAEVVNIPDLHALDAAQLIKLLNRPEWGNSQQSVALHCIKKFLRWRFGDLHPALAARIKRIEPPPRRSLNPDRALKVLASFNTYTPAGARDQAIIALGLDTGFRRQELCDLNLADVDFYNNTARALCKGGQWGIGAFTEETAQVIQRWLNFRKPADGVNTLFVNIYNGAALTGYGLGCIFKRLSKRVGFQISPHDLRSSFATLATFYGAPSRSLQVAGRWRSPEMVEHYTGNLQIDAVRPFLAMAHLKNR
ncbi:MAG: site-specific integrase [Anaerolineales bacterium]|nr:site-specific integrase [Anaerolineales bacterium]